MSAKTAETPWHVDAEGSVQVVSASGATVAQVFGSTRVQVLANADMLAAAPALLEALLLLEEFATATVKQLGSTSRPEMLDRILSARAAIAKVKP